MVTFATASVPHLVQCTRRAQEKEEEEEEEEEEEAMCNVTSRTPSRSAEESRKETIQVCKHGRSCHNHYIHDRTRGIFHRLIEIASLER